MALGKQLVTEARVVFSSDTAVDPETDWGAYARSGFDWQHLKLVAGEQPTVFTIAPLTWRQKEARDQRPSGLAQEVFSVRCGLRAIDNYVVLNGDPLPPLERKPEGRLGDLVTEKWLEEANLLEGHVDALATCIAMITELQAPLSRP